MLSTVAAHLARSHATLWLRVGKSYFMLDEAAKLPFVFFSRRGEIMCFIHVWFFRSNGKYKRRKWRLWNGTRIWIAWGSFAFSMCAPGDRKPSNMARKEAVQQNFTIDCIKCRLDWMASRALAAKWMRITFTLNGNARDTNYMMLAPEEECRLGCWQPGYGWKVVLDSNRHSWWKIGRFLVVNSTVPRRCFL